MEEKFCLPPVLVIYQDKGFLKILLKRLAVEGINAVSFSNSDEKAITKYCEGQHPKAILYSIFPRLRSNDETSTFVNRLQEDYKVFLISEEHLFFYKNKEILESDDVILLVRELKNFLRKKGTH